MASSRDWPGTIVATAFAGLAAYVLFEGSSMSAMGSVFPTTIGSAMLLLSLAVIARNLLTRPAPAPARAATHESTPRRLAFIVAMVAWTVLIPLLGFYLASLLAFAVILAIATHERVAPKTWVALGAIGLVIVTGFYLLMSDVLLIPLPRGLL